jgi:formyltetrahydrofolate deformylase
MTQEKKVVFILVQVLISVSKYLNMKKNTAVLLIHCPDRIGIVRAVTDFLYENNGNIVYLDQHTDQNMKQFFMRIEWEIDNFQIGKDKIEEYFETLIAKKFDMQFTLHFSDYKKRVAVFVTSLSHCLYDILYRYQSGEWHIEIPLIVSNHDKLRHIAEQFNIPYFHMPMTKDTKEAQEAKQLEILAEHKIDLVILARYMQIISSNFISHYPNRIINIHHSFLPAFVGAKPYHSAHQRGVKIIGATAHYVTQDLDAGPIIEQGVEHVSHKEEVSDYIRKGKDIEKIVLSKAIAKDLSHKILAYNNRTVVFD